MKNFSSLSVIIVLVISFLPLTFWLPLPVSTWCAFSLLFAFIDFKVYSILGDFNSKRRSFFTLTFAILAIVLFFAIYGRTYSIEACVSFLSLIAVLKPLESSRNRDKMVSLCHCYFLTLSTLFFSNTLPITIYALFSVLSNTVCLFLINNPRIELKASIKFATKTVFAAIPLAICMFFAFPRVTGGIWGVKVLSNSRTGFSEIVSPGAVSRLIQSNDIAFRAEFEEQLPDTEDMYWRGIVFDNFDGTNWLRKFSPRNVRKKFAVLGKEESSYTVVLEPHDARWIFALDIPVELSYKGGRANIMLDHLILTEKSVEERIRYNVRSVIHGEVPIDPSWSEVMLQLPKIGNEKSYELGRRFAKNASSSLQIVERGLAYFTKNGFAYTLTPQAIHSTDFVDTFLFETKAGFCEHFASSFAFLMRAAGVPSRLVGGYLGGEVNSLSNLVTVKQSSAHLWVEVWIDGRGWVRIDPTVTVSPSRLTSSQFEGLENNKSHSLFGVVNFHFLEKGFKRMRMTWEMLNFSWQKLMLDYSKEARLSFFKTLGIDLEKLEGNILLIAICIAFLTLTFIIVSTFRNLPLISRANLTPIGKVYRSFLKLLARKGVKREAWMGPRAFADIAKSSFPAKSKEIELITKLFLDEQFGGTKISFAKHERKQLADILKQIAK